MKTLILLGTFLCLAAPTTPAKRMASPSKPLADLPTFEDSRDGSIYSRVKIGKQTWMASNLNHSTSGSWCYGGSESLCQRFGRLYTWESAQKACPTGWHLPSDQEWGILETTLGDPTGQELGKKLKATSWGGIDAVKFRAMPGGFRLWNGDFLQVGKSALFWTSTQSDAAKAWYRLLGADFVLRIRADDRKEAAMSVRCLKD